MERLLSLSFGPQTVPLCVCLSSGVEGQGAVKAPSPVRHSPTGLTGQKHGNQIGDIHSQKQMNPGLNPASVCPLFSNKGPQWKYVVSHYTYLIIIYMMVSKIIPFILWPLIWKQQKFSWLWFHPAWMCSIERGMNFLWFGSKSTSQNTILQSRRKMCWEEVGWMRRDCIFVPWSRHCVLLVLK